MDEQAAGDFDTDHCNETAVDPGQLHLPDQRVERGLHGVVADFPHPCFNRVQPVEWDAQDVSALVFDPQNGRSTPTVRHGGQLVGEFVVLGRHDAGTGQQHPLELQRRILAEADAPLQLVALHHSFWWPGGMMRWQRRSHASLAPSTT